jgi:hypothetical protein
LEKLSSETKSDLSIIFLLKSGDALAKENVLLWIAVDGNSFIRLLVVVLVLFILIDIGLDISLDKDSVNPLLES